VRWYLTIVSAGSGLWLVALFGGCALQQYQPEYHPALSNLELPECRALQSVISDRAAYGIVPRSPAQEEAELPQCFGDATPSQQTRLSPPPSVQNHEEVQIEKRGSSYYVPVRINDTITLPFLLDTGAGDLAIPADVARTLIRAGALKSGDLIGKRSYQIANGSEEVSPVVSIREVRVGEHVVRSVTAGITPANGEPLLGQSFLSKFGAVTVDYKRLVLVLSP
jgi:clan AA aspartic protease (TIGR02281 family)